jgi:small-conductance mechanosensitive channel
MRLILIFLLRGALFTGLPTPGGAQTTEGAAETPALMLERWDAESGRIEQRLAEDPPQAAEIDEMRGLLDAQRNAIPDLITTAKAGLEPLRQQLQALGEPPEDPATETPEIADARKRLIDLIAAHETGLKRASQAEARAIALLAQLTELRRALFTEQLLNRGPSLLDPAMPGKAVAALGRTAGTIRLETTYRLEQQQVSASWLFSLLTPVIVVLLAGLLLLTSRRSALDWLLRQIKPDTPHSRRAAIAVGIMLIRLLLPAAALVITVFAIDHSDLLGPRGEAALAGLARAAALAIAANALGGAFFAPRAPGLRLSHLDDLSAVHAHRWLIALAAVVGFDRALVTTGQDLGMAIEGLSLLNIALLVLGGITLWRFVHFLQPPPEPADAGEETETDEAESDETPQPLLPGLRNGLIWLARLVCIAAPLLAFAGYFAASRYVFYPLVASGGVIGVGILLFHAVRECVWQVANLGGTPGAEERKVSLIPVVVAFVLICAAVPVLALIWGADATDLSGAWRAISDGFSVGNMVISPLDFFSFLLVFSVGYVLTRIIQGVLNRSVLPVTRLDSGGKAAISAGVGYVGISLAALVAISATGLDLSNLAIVAGALSVGIGFGLQNIVNNFVSGLILLIERPIKAGDWVDLPSGTGYVKQINVRSTEIQTFDRASLIVPNSELISGPVTNWTHTNLNGRLIVPIGVAYGTDPKRVETILTEIAKAHPMLLRRPAPYVLFRRFGADSLDFEIRGVLRDVNWILNVTSEINFEISRRFTEEGIEIPFAQRDLHLRNAGELGRSIGDALRGGQTQQAQNPIPQTPPPKNPPRRPSGPSEAAGNEPDGDT